MNVPIPAFSGKKKFLDATVILTLPKREADSQDWGTYNPEEMAIAYKKALVENLIEEIESPFEDDTLGITVEVIIVTED